MPNKFSSTFVAGDANRGAGYGTIKKVDVDANKLNADGWPYVELGDRYPPGDDADEDAESEDAVFKRSRRYEPGDHLQQLNYKTGAFVNGSTRGLTGIMSGMTPIDVLQGLIREIGMSGARGQASKSYDATGPWDARTRPGQQGGVGTTRGWSNTPVPKETDPENEDHAWTLKDVARPDDVRVLRRNAIRMRDARKRDAVVSEQIGTLRSYVRMCLNAI